MKSYWRTVIFILIISILFSGCSASMSSTNTETVSASLEEAIEDPVTDSSTSLNIAVTSKSEVPIGETPSQSNAVRSAKSYLDYSAFSRQGLIEQLEFEGFSNADAVYGADHSDADWNEQAAKSAENHLEYSSFSRQGLIEQLEFEGFTHEQAI